MRRRLGDLLGLLCLGLARCLLLALAGGGHRGLGRLFAPGLLRRSRRRDFLHLVVLERRDLGGLRRGLVLQGSAALLVHLREVVGLLRRLVALEGGQGDFQGLADLARRGHGEAHPEDEGDVQDGCDEQGEAQTVRRADAGSSGGDLRTAAFIADRGGWRGAKSADGGGKVHDALRALGTRSLAVAHRPGRGGRTEARPRDSAGS